MVVVVIVVVKFKQESELCFGCCSLALVFCLLLTWFDLVQVWFIFFTVIGWEIGVAVGLQKSAAVFSRSSSWGM